MVKKRGKGVSVMMMTAFSGRAYKAPRVQKMIEVLEDKGILARSFGLYSKTDRKIFNKTVTQKLHGSILVWILFKIDALLFSKIFKLQNAYYRKERLYGLCALFSRCDGNVVIAKPRPAFLIKAMKRRGKTIIVEASECHTNYTKKALLEECRMFGIPPVRNAYTDDKLIGEYIRGIELADYIICLSDFSKKTYLEQGVLEEKLFVVRPTVESQVIYPIIKIEEDITFICVANHGVLKGTHRLVELWQRNSISNDLLIIGNIYDDFKMASQKYEKNEHIRYMGYMKREEILKIYTSKRCVGVLLSVSEAFGRATYEYLCASIPVIVSPATTCDLVENGKNGFIVNTADVEQLGNIIDTYNKMSPMQFEQMRKAAYDSVKPYQNTFESSFADAIEAIIKRI